MPVEYIINVQEYTAFFIGLVGEIQISEALCLEVFVGISIPLSQGEYIHFKGCRQLACL